MGGLAHGFLSSRHRARAQQETLASETSLLDGRRSNRRTEMRRLFAPAALAAAAAISVLPALACAEEEGDVEAIDMIVEGQPLSADTIFDLGIDVTGVPKTPAGVRAFLLGLAPNTKDILVTTCQHYMEYPEGVQSHDTKAFCSNVAG
jgi:hypothetical protein